MANPKILIAAGCSFTQVPQKPSHKNWPLFVSKELQLKSFYLGTGAADNGIIANKVLFQLDHCLNNLRYQPKDLLVGVMWSGCSRHHFYLSNEPISYCKTDNGYTNGDGTMYAGIPNKVVSHRHYYFVQDGWADELSEKYYKIFYDDMGAVINSFKNMLLVQSFLKANNINYFFTEALLGDSPRFVYKKLITHNPDDVNEAKFLYDLIDHQQFLPVESMGKWNIESKLPFIDNDSHPTTEMSERFAHLVIIPHLKKKGYVK